MIHGIALRYFVEVARTGSLAAASETLHVAVSAISRQIGKLEQGIGTPLFERLPRGMVLTESGELLAAHARRTLLEAESVLDEISAGQARGSGLVRMACTEGFTRSFLPHVLAQHHASHPHTRFVLRSGTPSQVETWIASGDVDLAVAFSSQSAPNVQIEYQVKVPVCVLLAPSHPLAARETMSLADLRDYPVALLERGATARQLFEWCCSQQGVKIEPVLTSNNTSVLHAFAAQSLAVTLGSRLSLVGLKDDLKLVARHLDEAILNERTLWVMTMRDRRLPMVVKGLLAAVIAAIRANVENTPG